MTSSRLALEVQRYFRDPLSPDQPLRLGMSGTACANLKQAMRALSINTNGRPDFSDLYDETLAADVTVFQTAHDHPHRDGVCGPGTRALLAKTLLAEFGPGLFLRMPDPEHRDQGHAFVSYARSDRARATPLIELMRNWGYSVWYDDQLMGGDDWAATLNERVSTAFIVIVLLSEASVASTWVRKEIELADAKGLNVLPLMLDPLASPHALSPLLDKRQRITDAPVTLPLEPAVESRLADALRVAHLARIAAPVQAE